MVEIDDTRFPLIVMRWQRELSEADVVAFENYTTRRLNEEVPYAIAITASGLAMPEVALLKRLASYFNLRREAMAETCLAVGIHLESAVLRGAVKFLNTLSAPPSPQRLFATWEATLEWCSERLRAASIDIPAAD